ncbi:MAG: flagellar basal body-associated FliL family protein [Desulfuromonadales bacterium]|nr:flagellar basal body-associated FliL family protein [Desulfuromonadales bacterium]MBN2792309.1 flagellar basal body-associated FliL family protein [Desulfuromonadales bacterium]
MLIGAGVGAFFFMGGEEEKISPEEEQAELERQAKQVGPMVNIDSFVVNILDDEESRYLKAAITLEVSDEEASMELTQRMPQVKDAILLMIGNKTFSELNDLQGKIQLRAELINKVNSLLEKGRVKRIYFTDFVIQ